MTPNRILTVGSQSVHVFDDVLVGPARARVDGFCRLLPFTRIRYGFRDAAAAELRHGHQWVHPVAPDERAFLPLDALHRLAEQAMGERLDAGRVHVNCIQPGDDRYPHIDDSTGRVVVAVYFANDAWQPDWMGELTFFHDGEAALAVAPRPGRVVVFDGTLLHRGGVPLSGCPDVRYAIAHKFLRAA